MELTEKIIDHKLRLISSIGQAKSIRDFGGMWKVDGLYLVEGAKDLKCEEAEMIDKLKTEKYEESIKGSVTTFLYHDIDFRELATSDLYPMEVSLLNDVVLHQDNFTEVLKQVSRLTTKYIVIQQPCYEGFNIPSSCSLLQFMPMEWRKKLYNIMWVDQSDQEKFNVDIWMWAQSRQLLIDILKGYGWTVEEDKQYTFLISDNWFYTGLVFKKS